MVRLTPFDEWFPANVRGLTSDCREPMRDVWVLLELDAGPLAKTFPIGTRELMSAEIASWLLGTVRDAGSDEANLEPWASLVAEQVVDDCLRPDGESDNLH